MKGNYYIIFRVSTTVFIFPQKRYSKTRKTISQLCVVKNFVKFFFVDEFVLFLPKYYYNANAWVAWLFCKAIRIITRHCLPLY